MLAILRRPSGQKELPGLRGDGNQSQHRLGPEAVFTPSIYVDRVVHLPGVTELAEEGAAG